MSDPIRWRNDPSAPGSVRDLLSQARATPPMPPDVQASLAQGLAQLGPSPVSPPSLLTSTAFKMVAGLALAGAATWGGVKLLSRPAPPPVVPVAVAPSPSPAPIAEAPKVGVAPEQKPVPHITPVPTRAPAKGDRLKEEEALLKKAHEQLASDPFLAFRLLEQHRHRFTSGQLAEERDALTIDALGKLGRTGEQRRRAAMFLKHYATSPYAERVRKSVERP